MPGLGDFHMVPDQVVEHRGEPRRPDLVRLAGVVGFPVEIDVVLGQRQFDRFAGGDLFGDGADGAGVVAEGSGFVHDV
ncbi:hypothetical protein SDC9_195014 [bioreactor metagenome]|uniref:Uncharacterized protein n=1 Tax=bioreactor metagenome TaxID=1076179 RepID=A0A645I9C9_9ZZZZ